MIYPFIPHWCPCPQQHPPPLFDFDDLLDLDLEDLLDDDLLDFEDPEDLLLLYLPPARMSAFTT